MQLIDLLNQLNADGQLSQLYQAGALNTKYFNYKGLVLPYRALLATPTYADQPGRAAQSTSAQYRISLRTFYRAIEQMERIV